MNKRDLFVKSLKSGLYSKLDWVLSAFTVCETSEQIYPYKIKSDVTGHYYLDPSTLKDYIKIDDAVANEPIYKAFDVLEITNEDIINLDSTTPIPTNYGNLLANYCLLVYPFGNKIPYMNGQIRPDAIEEYILPRFKNKPKTEQERSPEFIYTDEYVKLGNAIIYMCGFTQIFTWGLTEKIIMPPEWVAAEKAKLLEKYKDRLNEAAIVAVIDAELIKLYREHIKGDPGENFLISKKSISTVAKKKYLMVGGELGLSEDTVNVDLIQNSLAEGWDINYFPQMNNVLRAGSFNRGAQTVLGGVAVKGLLRASANLNVTEDDCGSSLGLFADITEDTINRYVGRSIVTKDGAKTLHKEEDVGEYLGKRVLVRSPMYCKLTKTDYCKVCLGTRLANNPEALSIAVSEYGSIFLALFMEAAHSKALELAKLDWKKQIK